MPLRAIVDGKDVIGPLLGDEEWDCLKAAVKAKQKTAVLPCCDGEARLRVSKLGTKHFFHKAAGHCDWKPETVQHLLAKAEIARCCKEAGYEVSTEVTGPDWRADVLASEGKVRVAFEIQWSPQSLEETVARQKRYARDGVRACWLFRKPPAHVSSHDLPIFGLTVGDDHAPHVFYDHEWVFPLDEWGDRVINPVGIGSDENATWSLSESNRNLPLSSLIGALLVGEVRYRSKATMRVSDRTSIDFSETSCWRCHKPSHIYSVEEERIFRSGCGLELHRYKDSRLMNWGTLAAQPHIRGLVREFLTTKAGRALRTGAIKPRHSMTAGKSYMSFGCPYCDALFGEWYLYDERLEKIYEPNQGVIAALEKVTEQVGMAVLNIGHWCFRGETGFCAG